jgi:predicted enzyme related to lactoylglutathione lyase
MKKLVRWVEIPAKDFERAVKFYNQVFNLNLKPLDFGSEKMACLPNDEGAISLSPGFKPSENGVLVSLETGNKLDETLLQIKTAGGKIIKQKTKIEAEGRGYFALFIDSEGNRLGLYGD